MSHELGGGEVVPGTEPGFGVAAPSAAIKSDKPSCWTGHQGPLHLGLRALERHK